MKLLGLHTYRYNSRNYRIASTPLTSQYQWTAPNMNTITNAKIMQIPVNSYYNHSLGNAKFSPGRSGLGVFRRFYSESKVSPEVAFSENNEVDFEIPESFQEDKPVHLDELKRKAAEEHKLGWISEETLKKLESLNDEEAEQKRSFKRVGGVVAGRKAVKFGGLKDMKLRRWYNDVTVEEVLENNKWTVLLEDRLLVSRNDKPLFLPTKQMALAVAAEWEAIEGQVPLALLPLTSLLSRTLDDMPKFRDYYQTEILDFLENDHVCFRDEDEQRDYEKQLEFYQPIVECFTKQTGLELGISRGCSSQNHPQKTIDTIHLFMRTLVDDFTFHLFHSTIHATKSVATAIALWANAITVEHAISAVSLEEDLNSNEHGFVEGAHDLKRAQTVVDVHCAALLLQLSGVPAPNQKTLSLLGDATEEIAKIAQNEVEKEVQLNEMMLQKFKDALQTEIAADPENKKALQFFISSLEQKKEEYQSKFQSKPDDKKE